MVMKFQEWNESVILTQQQEIMKEYLETQNRSLLLDTEILSSLLSKNYVPFIMSDSYKDRFEEDITSFIMFEPFFEEIEEFSKIKRYIPIKDYVVLDELNISSSELISFVHDFYLGLDNELFRYFKNVFKERKNNLMFSDDRSIQIYSPNLDYSYINVQKTDTIQDYINITHEYMHSICDRMYFRHNDDKYPFDETASTFVELLVLDLLENIYGFNVGYTDSVIEVNKLKANQSLLIANYSKYILIEASYLSQVEELKSKKTAIKEMAKMTKQKITTIYDIMSNSAYEKYLYTIAYITALELFALYKVDPEKALYKLKQIINMPPKENYYAELLEMNILLNDNSKAYIKNIHV